MLAHVGGLSTNSNIGTGKSLQPSCVDSRRSADARRGVSPSLNQPALLNFHSLLTRREHQTPSNSPRARCALRQMTANPPSSCTVYLLKAGKSLPAGSAHSMRASGAMFPSGSRIIASTLSITLPTAQVLSVRGSGGRSISFRKDECHVMHPLLRKIFNILVHLGNIHTHSLDWGCVRFSRRSREESQLQAKPDQENCNNSDTLMHAHASPPANRSNSLGRIVGTE